ncbi:NAD(P)-binding protein [Atractiella rhizophila]|nr:NAD(P)-binding protein [Atractiella rhizophila]
MILSSESSAPLVALTGITGHQGSSVANALIQSPKPYRLRGFSRDITKQASVEWKEKGVQMVAVNLIEEVSVFLAEKSAATGIPYAVVQPGIFVEMVKPRDGKLSFPTAPDTRVPFYDIREFGLFVQAAIEQPERTGTIINVFADARSLKDAAKDLAEGKSLLYSPSSVLIIFLMTVTERPFEYVQVPVREGELAKRFPEHVMLEMEENLAVWDEFGYFGTKYPERNDAMKDTKLTTWKEWVTENKDQFA